MEIAGSKGLGSILLIASLILIAASIGIYMILSPSEGGDLKSIKEKQKELAEETEKTINTNLILKYVSCFNNKIEAYIANSGRKVQIEESEAEIQRGDRLLKNIVKEIKLDKGNILENQEFTKVRIPLKRDLEKEKIYKITITLHLKKSGPYDLSLRCKARSKKP